MAAYSKNRTLHACHEKRGKLRRKRKKLRLSGKLYSVKQHIRIIFVKPSWSFYVRWWDSPSSSRQKYKMSEPKPPDHLWTVEQGWDDSSRQRGRCNGRQRLYELLFSFVLISIVLIYFLCICEYSLFSNSITAKERNTRSVDAQFW